MSKKVFTVTPPQVAIEVNNVTKLFVQWQRENKNLLKNLLKPEKKEITALKNVSFTVNKGEFVAYAGPNGAGKSTTMKLLSGMLRPGEGQISLLSLSPVRDRVQLMKKLGVLFGNRTELWWDHPVSQSFLWKKAVWGIEDTVYEENLSLLTELLDIGPLLKTYARELSLGQRMRADLAMMLLHSPEVILLDEPTLGLDVVAKRQMIDFLKKINAEKGVTILVTSHDMDDLEEMAQRIIMVSAGSVVYDGDFPGLRDIAGSMTLLTVTMDGSRPRHLALEGGTLRSEKEGVYEFEVDLEQTPIRTVLKNLSNTPGVKDVEIKKAPIEQVISTLYQSWGASPLLSPPGLVKEGLDETS